MEKENFEWFEKMIELLETGKFNPATDYTYIKQFKDYYKKNKCFCDNICLIMGEDPEKCFTQMFDTFDKAYKNYINDLNSKNNESNVDFSKIEDKKDLKYEQNRIEMEKNKKQKMHESTYLDDLINDLINSIHDDDKSKDDENDKCCCKQEVKNEKDNDIYNFDNYGLHRIVTKYLYDVLGAKKLPNDSETLNKINDAYKSYFDFILWLKNTNVNEI